MSNPFASSKPKNVYMPPPATPDPAPPPPAVADPDNETETEKKLRRYGGSAGRASTFFTSSGVDSAAGAVRFLGGASKT